jgi:tRNA threonylcarbamoyladenosine biosynthesis protein TsaB
MTLFIDTSGFDSLRLALIDEKTAKPPKPVIRETTITLAYNENYKTVHFLQKFLQKNKIKPKDLSKIIVCSGPGSFTGIRVGVALAEALGFALNIPAVAIKKTQVPQDLAKLVKFRGGKNITLNYGQKPNITKPPLLTGTAR